MKSLRILRELLVGACVWFTVLAFCLILIRAIVQGSSGNTGISILHFALLFPCALGFSGARMIRKGAFAAAGAADDQSQHRGLLTASAAPGVYCSCLPVCFSFLFLLMIRTGFHKALCQRQNTVVFQ